MAKGTKFVPDEAQRLFDAGATLPTEPLMAAEPERRVPEARAEFVAGIMSQYAFGEKPSKAQREEAITVAREALDRLARLAS